MTDVAAIPIGGEIINLLIFAALGVAILVVLGILIYTISKKQIFGTFPYRIRVWVRRGSNVVLFETLKARFVTINGKDKTQVVRGLMNTEYLQKFTDDYIDANNVINVISPQKGEYHPVKPIVITEDNEIDFRPQINQSAALIHADNVKQIHDDYNRLSTIEKLMPIMVILGTGICVMLIAWAAGSQMVEAVGGMNAAAQAFAQAKIACAGVFPAPPI